MMFGSIFYNLWGALIGFTLYFFLTLSQSYLPNHILIGSFVSAIIMFFAMFVVRLFLYYILYTPEETVFESFKNENDKRIEQQNAMENNNSNSTVEYSDESSEEIAKVVRTMMNQEEPVRG